MPRIPLLRGFLPRLARPLLPLTRIPPTPPLTRSRITTVPSFFRSFYTSRSRLTHPSSPTSPTEPQTLSSRLKTLIRTYGWYTLGVYMILSALDFGVAFAAINFLGADHVAHVAASVKTFFLNLIDRTPSTNPDTSPQPQVGGHEGLYAMLVLAYTIHKTLFLPVRVGLTAAVTPRFVGWLAHRGWTGSDGAKRAAQVMRERIRRRPSN